MRTGAADNRLRDATRVTLRNLHRLHLRQPYLIFTDAFPPRDSNARVHHGHTITDAGE